ncbi:MAG: hypothetical protein QM770_00480 [Tepidisphaeraceae bacterium]
MRLLRPSTIHHLRSTLAVLSIAATLSLAGCTAIGFAAHALEGPPKVQAQFTPAKVPTLVLVEPSSAVADPTLASVDGDRVARFVTKQLDQNKVVPTISPEQLVVLRDATFLEYRKMTIVQIARRLNAEQVIAVELDPVGVGTSSGSDALKGVAACRVRVIDVATQSVVYPTDMAAGAALGYETPIRPIGDKASASTVRTEALEGLSDQIAKLFYTWTTEDETGKTLMK